MNTAETRLELVATVGPASFGMEAELLKAGASALRLNASHLLPDALFGHVVRIRRAVPDARLVIDLKGSKIRLGRFAAFEVRAGETVTFALPESGSGHGSEIGAGSNSAFVPLPAAAFFEAAQPGDTFTIGDGALTFRVLSCGGSDGRLTAAALSSGVLSSKKGVTLSGRALISGSGADREEQDAQIRAVVEAAQSAGSSTSEITWALSFADSPDDVSDLRKRLPAESRVIAKIERRAAIERLSELAEASDALWICRGDMGEQLGLAAMARFVSRFSPASQVPVAVPVLLAGQTFHHLAFERVPTRAEICQLSDALERGYAGVVLSDETAVGPCPAEAVRTVRTLMDELCADF